AEEVETIAVKGTVVDDTERPNAIARKLRRSSGTAPEQLCDGLCRVPCAAHVETRNPRGGPLLLRADELRIVLVDANPQCAGERETCVRGVRLGEVLAVVGEDVARSRVGPARTGVGADPADRPDDERVGVVVDDVRVERLGPHTRDVSARVATCVSGDTNEPEQVRLDKPDSEVVVIDDGGPV